MFCLTVFAQPKIEAIPGTKLNFGEVYGGSKVEQMLTIRNAGTDTLRIGDVSASCGCTATLLSKKNLAPAETSQLSISFNSANFSGTVSKYIYIPSNDPANPRLTVSFTATVQKALGLNPNYLWFTGPKIDSTYVKTITISNSSREAITILSVNSQFEDITVNLLKNQLMPGEETQLQAVYHPKKPGRFDGNIQIKTDHPKQPNLDVRVSAWIK